MNIFISPARRKEGMALWAVVVLFLLFLVFIGTLIYILWQAMKRIPNNPSGARIAISELNQPTVNAMAAKLMAQYGTTNVVPIYLIEEPTNVVVFLPFGTNPYPADIERSTNMVDWEVVSRMAAGEVFVDTNPPPVKAFYRRFYWGANDDLSSDTNHVPGFYYIPR